MSDKSEIYLTAHLDVRELVATLDECSRRLDEIERRAACLPWYLRLSPASPWRMLFMLADLILFAWLLLECLR